MAGLFSQPNVSARLADLEAQIRENEDRLAAIASELAGLGEREIDGTDVTDALQNFTGVIGALSPAERERLVHLLVERVVYDGPKSSVAITFYPAGVKTLSQSTEA